MRPFIFIAAQQRSGSTLLAEVLSTPPVAMVFKEPGLCRGEWQLKPGDTQRIERPLEQEGCKEIHLEGWRETVPKGAKVLATCRDPRGLYLSYYRRHRKGRSAMPFCPHIVAENATRQMRLQQQILEAFEGRVVRYEDLCTNEKRVWALRDWCGCPEGLGDVGGYLATHPNRLDEHEIHGFSITKARIEAWKTAKPALRAEAEQCKALMGDYCAFFGY